MLNTPTSGLEESHKKEKKKVSENMCEEITVENFLTWERKLVNQVKEAQRVPYRINARRNTLRYIQIKSTKIKHTKKRILKAARGKATSNIQGKPHVINS